MKHLFLTLIFITTAFYAKAQEEKPNIKKSIFYLNIGGNIAAYNKEGFQAGISINKKKENFHFQYINNKSEMKKSTSEQIKLNVTTKIEAISLTYGYNILNNSFIKIIPSIGILGGKETYRTDSYEEIPGTRGGGFGGCIFSCSYGPSYSLNYERVDFIAGQISLKFHLTSKSAYVGLGIENYLNINNHGRLDFGIMISILIGKPN